MKNPYRWAIGNDIGSLLNTLFFTCERDKRCMFDGFRMGMNYFVLIKIPHIISIVIQWDTRYNLFPFVRIYTFMDFFREGK